MKMELDINDLKFIITEHFKIHKLNIGSITFLDKTIIAEMVPPVENGNKTTEDTVAQSKFIIDNDIANIIKAGGKITAIKKLREYVPGMSLFTAKDYIDYYSTNNIFKTSFI